MSANSEEIVQHLFKNFESLLLFVQESSPATVPNADAMERSIFKRLFELGRMLLQLYFSTQNKLHVSETVAGKNNERLALHSNKETTYHSVFGKVKFSRRYYYRKGEGCIPLDAALNLPECGASDLLREWREKLCVHIPFDRARQILDEMLGHKVSTRELKQDIAEDAQCLTDFYDQVEKPAPVEGATILVLQADGKGIPLRQTTEAAKKARKGKGEKTSCKKEAIVTSVYTLFPLLRTPFEVVNSLFEREKYSETSPKPCNKRLFATLNGKEEALSFTAKEAGRQQGSHIRSKVALTDGSEALQKRVQSQFPDFTLVLDCIHAIEYLWKAANVLKGETSPEREPWVKCRALWMLSGQIPELIDDLRKVANDPIYSEPIREKLLSVSNYFERNRAYMRYDEYMAKGWPIATGVIEGACRHLVKDRFELSGMRWNVDGAECMLGLRSVAENGDWENFQSYRRSRRQITLYGKTVSNLQASDIRIVA